jgi:unsaturated pyranuronate lyase
VAENCQWKKYPLKERLFYLHWGAARVECAGALRGSIGRRLGGNDMQHFTWETVKKEVMNPKIWRKVITGEKAMVAQVFLAKDAVVPLHQHESEQLTYIFEGALKLSVEGKDVVVRKGEVLHIPSNVPHSAVALEDTLDLDIFSPIRMDWLTGQDDYLRRG